MKKVKVQDYTCKIGQNAKDNWNILDSSLEKYYFFHLSKFPSCYVILETEEKVNDSVLEICARICLNNTKYRKAKNINVDCTTCDNIEKGTVIGEITYKSKRKVKRILI
tara:strand:- start:651 stop:977 length:327 start_codon:yes stop_codon:yes gene_type:complete